MAAPNDVGGSPEPERLRRLEELENALVQLLAKRLAKEFLDARMEGDVK